MLSAIGLAVYFGILTSISPCPMAGNIAAVSFIGRDVENRLTAVYRSLAYIAGRSVLYIALSILLAGGASLIPAVSMTLQKYSLLITGPVLFIIGVLLTGIIKFKLPGHLISHKTGELLVKKGVAGTFILGVLFALAFCPVSAGFFFSNVLNNVLERSSFIILPLAYGLGTALPVVVLAVILAFSANLVGGFSNRLVTIGKWARRISAGVFIAAGLYLIVTRFFLF